MVLIMRTALCSALAIVKLGAGVEEAYLGGGIMKRVNDNVMNGVLGILGAKQRALNDIFEFPNIPWPVMTLQACYSGRSETGEVAPAQFGTHSDAEMLGEF